jgi:branched-chain amino acid transport system ATP-binding protein
MSVLESVDLCIRFGGLQAATDVRIKVSELEIVGVIGPNGAGKTTTFNMITGFYTPTSGRVLFKGRDITDLAVHERAALGIGRTFQNVGLVKGSTVRENLLTAQHLEVGYGVLSGMLGSPASRAEERRLRARADAVLELMDLTHLASSKVHGLPYGDLKRVEIATVLATDPDIVLLDEPSSGMGPEESQELGDRLLRLRREMGLSILMIEHHVPLVTRVCDYVYCLSFGQLLAEGDPIAVRDDPAVVEAYLGVAAREQAEKEAREAEAARA